MPAHDDAVLAFASMRHPGTPKENALESLFGKKGARKFLEGAWPDEIFSTHRRVRDLPEVFRSGPLASFEALCEVYGGRLQIAGGRGKDHNQFSVEAAPATWLRRAGLTVFFGDDLCPIVPGLGDWLRGLEAELGAPARIGAVRAFAAPPGGGLEAHYDQGETFLVQLSGSKRLRVSENTSYPMVQFIPGRVPAEEHYAEYPEGFPAAAPNGRSVTMGEGSVLYLPRGAWHRTEAGTASFSLSICVDTPNAIEVLLPALKAMLRQSPNWRRPLIGGWSGDQTQALDRLRGLLAELGEVAPRIEPQLVLDGALHRDVASHPLRDDSRFQKVPGARLEISRDRMTIRVGDREARMIINAAVKPALRWLVIQQKCFTWSQLWAATAASSRGQLERCLRGLVEAEAVQWLGFSNWPTIQEAVRERSSKARRNHRRKQ
jgi:hypothetical protein